MAGIDGIFCYFCLVQVSNSYGASDATCFVDNSTCCRFKRSCALGFDFFRGDTNADGRGPSVPPPLHALGGPPACASLALEQVSEVDLNVGLLPGLPVSLKGTVVTKARLSPIRWEFDVQQ